jgi:hypothetical protein
MEIKGVSFSNYKANLDIYKSNKLDLFSFIFIQIILNEKLDRELKLTTCLKDLDIKEDLFYLFNNIYYKLIDNGIIDDLGYEDISDVHLKDIKIKPQFKEFFKQGYFLVKDSNLTKEFIYDYLNNKLVLSDTNYKESNVCVVEVNNELTNIERLINDNKKSLLSLSEGLIIIKNLIADPYYFLINLNKEKDYLKYGGNNKELVYKSLVNNSLFLNDEILEGEYLSNNIYFEILYGNKKMSEYCNYLFVYDEKKAYSSENNIIYLDYKLEGDFIDLVNKESYRSGKYKLENNQFIATYTKIKNKEISNFKLYLIKNKDKFKINISKIIELI